MSEPHYQPGPEEIAAACAEIRETWSDDEEQRRRSIRDLPESWSVPGTMSAGVRDPSAGQR